MAKNQADYQEGFNDACETLQKTHIPIDKVTDTFDKFLDKINKMKKVYNGVYNHYKKNLNLNSEVMITIKSKKDNIKAIIKIIEIDMLADQKSYKVGIN